jgi:hypothetical protein
MDVPLRGCDLGVGDCLVDAEDGGGVGLPTAWMLETGPPS